MVKKGVVEELPFEDNSFDIVISFNALDHTINPEESSEETYRVLRDNGEFLLWMYILRETYGPLQRILNKLDYPTSILVDLLMKSYQK